MKIIIIKKIKLQLKKKNQTTEEKKANNENKKTKKIKKIALNSNFVDIVDSDDLEKDSNRKIQTEDQKLSKETKPTDNNEIAKNKNKNNNNKKKTTNFENKEK